MPHKADLEDFKYLKFVTTLSGASRICGRHPNSIAYAIDAGNIAAVQEGGIWLVSIPSLVKWFPPYFVDNPIKVS